MPGLVKPVFAKWSWACFSYGSGPDHAWELKHARPIGDWRRVVRADELEFSPLGIGAIVTGTLIGAALLTLWVGWLEHRHSHDHEAHIPGDD
jgi:hypothetical protein